MEKNLILVRGVSGSGKTTFGELIGKVFSADDYFMKDGKYEFDATKLKFAHENCQLRVQWEMKNGVQKVVVANTFTTEWEMEAYFKLAKQYGYRIFTVIVENRANTKNIHGVPNEVLNKQKARFDIKL